MTKCSRTRKSKRASRKTCATNGNTNKAERANNANNLLSNSEDREEKFVRQILANDLDNSFWHLLKFLDIANAGGMITVIGYIGANSTQNNPMRHFSWFLIIPLLFFVGLILSIFASRYNYSVSQTKYEGFMNDEEPLKFIREHEKNNTEDENRRLNRSFDFSICSFLLVRHPFNSVYHS